MEDLLDVFPESGQLIRFGGRSHSENPRLADCHVGKFFHSSRWDFEERKQLEQQLLTIASELDQHVRSLTSSRWQLRVLLASLPVASLAELIEALGAAVVEAGLYLPQPDDAAQVHGPKHRSHQFRGPSPVSFIMSILAAWVDGKDLSEVTTYAAAWIPSNVQDSPVRTANRFAALDAAGEDADNGALPQHRILTALDRKVGPKPMAVLELVLGDVPGDHGDLSERIGPNSGLSDFEDVETLLDDRVEGSAGLWEPHGVAGSAAALASAPNASLESALRARMRAFQDAEEWEMEVAKLEAMPNVIKRGGAHGLAHHEGRLPEDHQLQRLLQDGMTKRETWQQTCAQLRQETVQAVAALLHRHFPAAARAQLAGVLPDSCPCGNASLV